MQSCLKWIVSICAVVCCLPLSAQSRSYHMELADGTSGRVAVANDSAKPIEAFHITGRCGQAGIATGYDVLQSPRDGGSLFLDPERQRISRDGVIAPQTRVFLTTQFDPQPSGCAWKGVIDGVIYTDGSFEGEGDAVRRMMAHRDGIVAAVNYWSSRLLHEGAEREDPGALAESAKSMITTDRMKGGNDPQSLQFEYWQGRSMVDRDISMWLKTTNDAPQIMFERTVSDVKSWQMKIEGNIALKKLDATFPPPLAIKEQGSGSSSSGAPTSRFNE